MIEEQLKQAKLACRKMQNIDKDTKIKALEAISKNLIILIISWPKIRRMLLAPRKTESVRQWLIDFY